METKLGRVLAVVILVGCGSRVDGTNGPGSAPTPEGGAEGTPTVIPAKQASPEPGAPAYDGKGFVVHEWGTNTVVVASDGSLQRGLHHEEEDLPGFVYDRMKQGEVSVAVKMETPVTYFYSDAPRKVSVNVTFPRGIFSQWFPKVVSFFPEVIRKGGKLADPFMDPSFPYSGEGCRKDSLEPKNGMLSWGDVEVLGREESVTAPGAPLDKYTWAFARDVAANGVRVAGGESEKFLFYRGLGNLPMGVKITSKGEGKVRLENADASEKVGTVFVLNVTSDHAAFVAHGEGIAPGGTLDEVAPSPTMTLDDYDKKLSAAMLTALEKSGLYRDEARGMVNTWSRQWFRTPGLRVLYVAPQAWTDAQIPLTITPAPNKQVRVMVIRNEILTTELESIDLKMASLFDVDEPSAKTYFSSLGRFTEPRLRRAVERLGRSPTGASSMLTALEGPDATRSTN